LSTPAAKGGNDLRQLGWTLAWAVVFCDIGTSIYYVPGILYHDVGDRAAIFIALVTIGFLFLAQKIQEVTWRNPEGGGVVSMSAKAFGPMAGAIGGMLIIVDYFLTAAISTVSGFHYLASVVPAIKPLILTLSFVGLVLLCALNIVGIKESAMVALWMAIAAFSINLVLVGVVATHMTPEQFGRIWAQARSIGHLDWKTILMGYGGAWLAFSGLESLNQLAPAMQLPLKRTSAKTMVAVVITMLLTSPTLAAFSIAALPDPVKQVSQEAFISELGRMFGGVSMAWAVVATASSLLIFASNTAVIGAYHVVLALANADFLPKVLTHRNRYFGTPHWAILLITVVPIGVMWATKGNLSALGHMYSFGLLGAFTFECVALDVVRFRERKFGPLTWIGLFTTGLVASAWAINIVVKWQATLFGGSVVVIGLLFAIGIQRDWFILWVNQVPWIAAQAARHRVRAEHIAMERGREIVSLETALEAAVLEPSRTMVALRDNNPMLIEEAILRARGNGDTAIILIAVTEWPGLFSGEQASPEPHLLTAIDEAAQKIRSAGLTPIPIWRLSHNAARSIAEAASRLRVNCVMLGVSQRSNLYHMLRGSVLKGLQKLLPSEGVLIHTVG
jgi:amino acid transporter